MTRRLRAVPAMVIAGLAVLLVVAASVPPRAVACTCVAWDSLRDWVTNEAGGTVAVGQVIRDRQDGSYELAVARWYGGTDRRPVVVIRTRPVDPGLASCAGGRGHPGNRLLFYGLLSDDGAYHLGGCSLTEDPTSDRGRGLERDAAALLGPAEEPRAVAEAPASDVPPPPASDEVLIPRSADPGAGLSIGLAALAVVAGAAALTAVGVRRRARPP